MQHLARVRAGRDHPHVRRARERAQVLPADAVSLEPPLPLLREPRRERVGRPLGLARPRLDPRPHVRRVEGREGQEQVRQVPLHIDGEDRHARAQRLLDQHGHEPGLAAARHAHHHPVRDEVVGGHVERADLRTTIERTCCAEEQGRAHGALRFARGIIDGRTDRRPAYPAPSPRRRCCRSPPSEARPAAWQEASPQGASPARPQRHPRSAPPPACEACAPRKPRTVCARATSAAGAPSRAVILCNKRGAGRRGGEGCRPHTFSGGGRSEIHAACRSY